MIRSEAQLAEAKSGVADAFGSTAIATRNESVLKAVGATCCERKITK